jgi:hypothetical protein
MRAAVDQAVRVHNDNWSDGHYEAKYHFGGRQIRVTGRAERYCEQWYDLICESNLKKSRKWHDFTHRVRVALPLGKGTT